MSLLDLIPAQYRILAELLAVAIAVGAIFYTGHLGGVLSEKRVMQAELDKLQRAWDAEKLATQQTVIQAQQKAVQETQQRLNSAKEQDREDQSRAERRADAAAGASGALERLQQRATVTACSPSSPGNSAAASVSQAASQASVVPAELLGRIGEAARQLATYADAAADASESCSKRYDSLTTP